MAENTSNLETLFERLFQAHPWHGVKAIADANTVHAYVEIVPNDTVKYELDKPSGHLRIDRPQRFSSLCPTLYGFIPQTYCGDEVARRCADQTGRQNERIVGDGDPLDICILSERSFSHGDFLLKAKPIGGLRMIDGNQADDKIVAVLEGDVAYGHLENLADVPIGVIERLRHYFLSYKQLPSETNRRVEIAQTYSRDEAMNVIEASQRDYAQTYGDPKERLALLKKLL
jgi:inorganic pyrophosphatase